MLFIYNTKQESEPGISRETLSYFSEQFFFLKFSSRICLQLISYIHPREVVSRPKPPYLLIFGIFLFFPGLFCKVLPHSRAVFCTWEIRIYILTEKTNHTASVCKKYSIFIVFDKQRFFNFCVWFCKNNLHSLSERHFCELWKRIRCYQADWVRNYRSW